MDYVVVPLAAHLPLGPGTFALRFSGCDFLAGTLPGQFVMLRAQDWGTDPLLPRAFSLLDVRTAGGGTEVDILIKASGKASRMLEHALPGARFSLLGPLGTSFPEPSPARRDWLIAGGVGLAPLYMHARRAQDMGLAGQVTLFYGGRSAADLVMLEDLARTGCEVVLATEDGSRGARGYVTDAVERAFDAASPAAAGPPVSLMACGPDPMLVATAALARRRRVPCHLSLEGEMACGIGICLACAVPCRGRPFRYTCVDGPVLPLDELAGRFAPEPAP